MVSKASIKNALDLAYKYGSLEFLCKLIKQCKGVGLMPFLAMTGIR